ncbi:hypothetical protein BCR36DRAFT_332223 [Piromyces finnis]|uniref:DUF676 domain-containing protein n=1 Tax=Piromyces finnis TaxID=1754191 RepID=A0A1Y1V4D3_9FUNG|nr:hypothetical protein BCR36DRAFT_332223 [Piromyces finnis]|eukprot:ORX46218.1 hypothetical protein BCR36DRAFT_332223 [Piromyces finnis]
MNKNSNYSNLNYETGYNYKQYKGNFLVPFLEEKQVTIVYVHGFLGSKKTFHEFPDIIKDKLKLYNVEVYNKIFPAFDTNGVFEDFVNMIISWLYSQEIIHPIILMGHSMGGILNADVYRKISKGDVSPELKDKKPPKIVGVFGFDTPYFGLSSSVAGGGVRKLKESLTKASKKVSSKLAENYTNEMNDEMKLLEDGQNNYSNQREIPECSSESSFSQDIKIIQQVNKNTITNIANNSGNSGKKRWRLLSSVVLSAANVAAFGSALLDSETRGVLINNGNQHWNEKTQCIINYAKFLEPLMEIRNQYQRVDDLINGARRSIMYGGERFKFKNYYPITQINKNGTTNSSTFICLPQDTRYLKYFDPVLGPSNSPDVVYSHTKMFNSQLNLENMNKLIEKCLIDLYKVIKSLY